MNKSVIFLTDDTPSKKKGAGLSVLMYNIINSLDNYQTSIITFCINAKASPYQINADNEKSKVLICDEAFFSKYRYKFVRVFCNQFKGIIFILSLFKISSLFKKADQQIIFTSVGVNIGPVCRAVILMWLYPKAKHCLYVVDEIIAINLKQQKKWQSFLISVFLPYAIKKANCLLTISTGLSDVYYKKFGKKSVVLLPHFEKRQPLETIPGPGKSFTFLFTGGLSLLYNDTIVKFAEAMEILNNKGYNVKLIIQTYSEKKAFDRLNLNAEFTSYSTTDNRNDLLDIYRTCDCFLVPYTFDCNNEQLVATSFPQKIAEIIQYNKKILVIAPAYSSVSGFFSQNNLPYICNDVSTDSIVQSIKQVLIQQVDYSKYINAYNSHLSKTAVNTIFDKIA